MYEKPLDSLNYCFKWSSKLAAVEKVTRGRRLAVGPFKKSRLWIYTIERLEAPSWEQKDAVEMEAGQVTVAIQPKAMPPA